MTQLNQILLTLENVFCNIKNWEDETKEKK